MFSESLMKISETTSLLYGLNSSLRITGKSQGFKGKGPVWEKEKDIGLFEKS